MAALPRIGRQNQEEVPSEYQYVSVSTTYSMLPSDTVVHVVEGTTYTIKLPPVAEAKGNIYTLRCVGTGTNTITIADRGDAAIAFSATMAAVGKFIVIYCDGEMYFNLVSN